MLAPVDGTPNVFRVVFRAPGRRINRLGTTLASLEADSKSVPKRGLAHLPSPLAIHAIPHIRPRLGYACLGGRPMFFLRNGCPFPKLYHGLDRNKTHASPSPRFRKTSGQENKGIRAEHYWVRPL